MRIRNKLSIAKSRQDHAVIVMPSDKKKVTYGAAAAVIVTILAYFGSQLLGGVIIGSIAGLMGYDEARIKAVFESSTSWQFAFYLIVQILTLLIVWWFINRRKIPLKVIGLGRRPEPRDVGYALITAVIYFALLIAVMSAVLALLPGLDADQKQQFGFESASGTGPLFLVFAALVIMPAIVEEIVVRGFLYTGLKSAMPYITAAISTSLLFAVAHLQLGSGAPPLWIAAIDTFLLSMVLIHLREKTGALWSGMLVHGLKNSVAFLGLYIFAFV